MEPVFKCSRCGEMKEANSFYPNKYTKRGYDYQCKKCEIKRKAIVFLCECGTKILYDCHKNSHLKTAKHLKLLQQINKT